LLVELTPGDVGQGDEVNSGGAQGLAGGLVAGQEDEE
jgi:hypothetical protein